MNGGVNNIKLRDATVEDVPVLKYWDTKPHVMDADPNDDWNWEYELQRTLSWRRQLIAELAGRPIGVVQIIDPQLEETHYWGDVGDGLRAIDIWIGEEGDLGKGYGTQMMAEALKICFSDSDVLAVIIDPLKSNVKAIRFYQRLGFRWVENKFFGDDECAVHRIERSDWFSNLSG